MKILLICLYYYINRKLFSELSFRYSANRSGILLVLCFTYYALLNCFSVLFSFIHRLFTCISVSNNNFFLLFQVRKRFKNIRSLKKFVSTKQFQCNYDFQTKQYFIYLIVFIIYRHCLSLKVFNNTNF